MSRTLPGYDLENYDLDADWSRENPLPGHDLEKVTTLNADWSREDLLPGHDLEKVTVPRP